jgi:hypothetical protein
VDGAKEIAPDMAVEGKISSSPEVDVPAEIKKEEYRTFTDALFFSTAIQTKTPQSLLELGREAHRLFGGFRMIETNKGLPV